MIRSTALIFFVLFTSSLLANEGLRENWNDILGAPPALNSAEELLDLQSLMELQETRTDDECAQAEAQEGVNLESFFGGKKGALSPSEIKQNKFLFYKYFIKAGLKTKSAKKFFARKRPFVRFNQIIPCISKPDPDESYPSGHTSIARIMAYALAKKYPERELLLFQQADEVGYNRMLGGVHFPTDVAAGKRLADYLAKKYFK